MHRVSLRTLFASLAVAATFAAMPALVAKPPIYTGEVTPRPVKVMGDWRELPLQDKVVAIELAEGLGGGPAMGRDLLRDRLTAAGVQVAAAGGAGAVRVIAGGFDDAPIQRADERYGLGLRSLVLPTEGYALRVVEDDGATVIVAAGADARGVFYALATLYQQVGSSDGGAVLRVANINDAPTWRQRFTSDYSTPTRDDLVRLALFKVNGLAIQHRYNWRNFRPDYKEYDRVFKELQAFKRETGLMDFMLLINVYAERPREHPIFDTTNEDHIQDLITRLRFAADHGIDHIMICVDDWTPMVQGVHIAPNEAERERFGRIAGAAHGYLMQRVHAALRPNYPNLDLSICPAPYSINHVKQYDTAGESRYLRDLAEALPADVAVVWTGPVVSSREIKREDFRTYASYVMNEQPLMLWDNTAAIASNHRDMPQAIARYYEGFEADSQGRIFLNTFGLSKPWVAISALSTNDYLWNPQGFDAADSHRRITEQTFGLGVYPFVEAYYNVERRIAAAGDDRGRAAEALAELEAATEAMKAQGLPTRSFATTIARHRARIEADPPRVRVPRIASEPVMDGKLDDAVWEQAAEVSAFVGMQQGQAVARTIGRVAYDGRALYLAFEAHHDEPLKDPIGADYRDAPVYALADNLQVFLQADTGNSLVQLAFDHQGNLFDMANNDKDWDAQWSVAIDKGSNVWTAEVRIPFESLMPPFDTIPQPGDVWTGNFCRSRPELGENASWSSTHGSRFTDRSFFGEWVFE